MAGARKPENHILVIPFPGAGKTGRGNPTKLLRFVVWGVKNRANHVVFDDTLLCGAKATWIDKKPFMVSQSVWDCIDSRGLKDNGLVWSGLSLGGS